MEAFCRLVDELADGGRLAKGGISGETCYYSSDAVGQLERQQNTCSDWSCIGFSSLEALKPSSLARIRSCQFLVSGDDEDFVVIGDLSGSVDLGDGIALPCGLYDSTLCGKCHVSNHVRVSATLVLKNVYVGEHASIVGCGRVVCDGLTSFGNHEEIVLGPENGGRCVRLEAGASYSDLCRQAFGLPDGPDQGNPRRIPCDPVACAFTVVAPHARIFRCDAVRNSFIGSHSEVSSSSLDSCTLISSKARPARVLAGAALAGCILHEGCSASNRCRANKCVLLETASLGDHARVVESVVAPDTAVAGGECHHSLVGPFVGFHHQSLLIATLWPLGRGNVGYGAMCGSNHTGRVNDQECWLGEGCFLGLGSAVKFPANLLGSPYSIIASAAVVPPQRLAYPFSLLIDCAGQLQVKPGWVLYSSPYTLERSAAKFAARRKAQQHCTSFPLMRPSVVELVRCARAGLRESLQLEEQQQQGTATGGRGRSQPGAGAGTVSPEDAARAVAAYSGFLRRYALHGLLYLLEDPQRREGLPAAIAAATAAIAANAAHVAADPSSRPAEPDALALLTLDLVLMETPDMERPVRHPLRSDVPAVLQHQLLVLLGEYPLSAALLQQQQVEECTAQQPERAKKGAVSEARRLLGELAGLEEEYCAAVATSKARDAERGRQVIPDYEARNAACLEEARSFVGRDTVVEMAHKRVVDVKAFVQGLLGGE